MACEDGGNDADQRGTLPIDDYAADIVEVIEAHHVTIIHGETVCGKSSRLPTILERAYQSCKTLVRPMLMVAQPRRLAVRMLADRLSASADLGALVGYRMGHGARREDACTRVWYVTVGYLVRLLAHRPEAFKLHTHLIIDEVHERSVDHDVLTLLARRLLGTNPRIRIVLMSATITGERFADYFAAGGAPRPPILFVGARCFPDTILHLSDFMSDPAMLPPKAQAAAKLLLLGECIGGRSPAAPSAALGQRQLEVAVALAADTAAPWSSVLMFVAGTAEVESPSERFDELNQRPLPQRHFRRYPAVPVHEEQLFLLLDEGLAAAAVAAGSEPVCRTIVATNAVEWSVTLAHVDVVICVGVCKRVAYDVASHRQRLEPAWISRASAQQRAGRTGRVRPGLVYRLYACELDDQMAPFDTSDLRACSAPTGPCFPSCRTQSIRPTRRTSRRPLSPCTRRGCSRGRTTRGG